MSPFQECYHCGERHEGLCTAVIVERPLCEPAGEPGGSRMQTNEPAMGPDGPDTSDFPTRWRSHDSEVAYLIESQDGAGRTCYWTGLFRHEVTDGHFQKEADVNYRADFAVHFHLRDYANAVKEQHPQLRTFTVVEHAFIYETRRDLAPKRSDMTRRDHFAALAMQGWLTTYAGEHAHPAKTGHTDTVAADAYALADAMIRARE